MKSKTFSILLAFVVSMASILSAAAEGQGRKLEYPYFSPRLETFFKPGNHRTISETDIFIPFFQRYWDIGFADIRGVYDNQNNNEWNFGAGYRRIVHPCFLVGGYSFCDKRKSRYGFHYYQTTAGLELLTENCDLRINGYFPIGHKRHTVRKEISSVAAANRKEGNGVVVVECTREMRTIERAVPGFDIETGFTVKRGTLRYGSCCFDTLFRLYAGYYLFKSKANKIPKMEGARGRFELEVRDIFNFCGLYESALIIEGSTAYDQVRRNQNFFSIGVRVPLQIKNKAPIRPDTHSLRYRLANRIYRDIDIVTEEGESTLVGTVENLLKNQEGKPLRVIYVDSDSTEEGSGTYENPYSHPNLITKETTPYDILYIKGNPNQKYNQVHLKLESPSLVVVGSGEDFYIGRHKIFEKRSYPHLVADYTYHINRDSEPDSAIASFSHEHPPIFDVSGVKKLYMQGLHFENKLGACISGNLKSGSQTHVYERCIFTRPPRYFGNDPAPLATGISYANHALHSGGTQKLFLMVNNCTLNNLNRGISLVTGETASIEAYLKNNQFQINAPNVENNKGSGVYIFNDQGINKVHIVSQGNNYERGLIGVEMYNHSPLKDSVAFASLSDTYRNNTSYDIYARSYSGQETLHFLRDDQTAANMYKIDSSDKWYQIPTVVDQLNSRSWLGDMLHTVIARNRYTRDNDVHTYEEEEMEGIPHRQTDPLDKWIFDSYSYIKRLLFIES